jgi:hypothetical protein
LRLDFRRPLTQEAVTFIVLEIERVERAVSADEALALLTALHDHAARANSTLGRQVALRLDAALRSVAREAIRLSPEERRELLAAMEAAELGHLEWIRLSKLRSAIWTAELTDGGE